MILKNRTPTLTCFEMFSKCLQNDFDKMLKLGFSWIVKCFNEFYPVFNFKFYATRFRQPSSPRSTDRRICSAIGPVYLVEGGCVSRFLEILGRNAHVEKRFDLIDSSMV